MIDNIKKLFAPKPQYKVVHDLTWNGQPLFSVVRRGSFFDFGVDMPLLGAEFKTRVEADAACDHLNYKHDHTLKTSGKPATDDAGIVREKNDEY